MKASEWCTQMGMGWWIAMATMHYWEEDEDELRLLVMVISTTSNESMRMDEFLCKLFSLLMDTNSEAGKGWVPASGGDCVKRSGLLLSWSVAAVSCVEMRSLPFRNFVLWDTVFIPHNLSSCNRHKQKHGKSLFIRHRHRYYAQTSSVTANTCATSYIPFLCRFFKYFFRPKCSSQLSKVSKCG